MVKKYRQSKEIEDRTGDSVNFSKRAMNAYNARAKSGQPNPLTYKEPLSWQHDDRTDGVNFKTNTVRPNNKVPGKGFITDTLAMAKNRKLGVKPGKLKFLEPKKVK